MILAPSTPVDPSLHRVLVVHNAYQQRGGEDSVVEAEIELLQQRGHAIALYRRSNDDIARMPRSAAALQTLWSRRTMEEVTELLQVFKPAIMHVHNSFPLVSPAVYWAASRAGVPVVQTLHNFRLLCPQALMLRDNHVCEDCVGHVPWRAVKHGCYRGSTLQSAVAATMLQTHRLIGTWQRKITRYIALNAFCRDKFIEGGLPAERIRIKPNFIDLPSREPSTRSGILFVGRMSIEKGIAVLAEGIRQAPEDCFLRAVGTGPEAKLLACNAKVTMFGGLAPAEVYRQMLRSTALVVPSIWYENFPRTVVEAFACGLPVIASRIGALSSLVHDGFTGLLFEPGNAADLAAKLAWAHAHPDAMAVMGQQARLHYETHLTGAVNYRQLISIYTEALADNNDVSKTTAINRHVN